MRTDICDAINAIPEVIATAQDLQEIYPNAAQLQAHASKLYVAILDVLQLSIGWYGRKCSLKFWDSFSKGKAYDRELEEALQALRNLEFRDGQASYSSESTPAGAVSKVHGVRPRSSHNTSSGSTGNVREVLKDTQKNNRWEEELARVRSHNQELREENRRRDRAFNMERKDMLVRLLKYNPVSARSDLEAILSYGAYVPEDTQNRIALISQSGELAKWLAKPTSCTLVVNGSEEDHRPESATSLFTALLLRGIASSQPRCPLIYWFCGERLQVPIERMLRGLIAQLIRQSWLDVRVPNPNQTGRLDQVGDLTSLLLWCLEAQSQHSPVICALDGVSFYEDQYRGRDLCYDFQKLVGFARRSRDSNLHPFRLLLTSPTRAMDICDSRAAMDADVLDVEEELHDAMHEFSEMDLVKHTERSLRIR